MRSVRLFQVVLAAAGASALLSFGSTAVSAQVESALFGDLKYRMIGPSRGGRVTTVTGVANQPATFYMGSTGGGVWKTTDYGRSWVNISDGYFATGSVGAIDVADSDPNVIYAGTGSDAIRSNVITGRGIYKSSDAGKSWTFVGLRDVGQIGAVEIDPRDPDVVLVAAIGHAFGPNRDRGVYRTEDGGSTWEKVLFVSDTTGAADLEFAPDNPDVIYASMWRGERKPWTIISGAREGGIYKSTDGGDSWTRLTNGLPHGLVGKSDLAVSPADPDRVYVLMEAPEGEGGVYRSDDRGRSFRLVNTQPGLLDRPFYYTNIDADPTDADILYVNSTGFYKSEDGGKTFSRRSVPHGDNHDMWINPNDSRIFIQSNDGGAAVTLDGGRSWSTEFNQPTAELYQVNVDDQFPYWVYAGQQDNSTIMVPSLPPYSPAAGATGYWQAIGGCETGPAVPKPGDPNIVFSNCKGRFGRYNKATGQEQQYYVGAANMYGHNPRDLEYRFQRVSPIEVSPHDPNVVYHGSQYLHRTTDGGRTWETISPDLTAFEPDKQVVSGTPLTRDITGEEFYSTIYAVEESPVEPGLIWVGANDGPVHVTRDGGETWSDVTPPDIPKGGRVQNIEPSPHSPGKAYLAIYRYLLDDWAPYIYRTENYGKSWTRLSTGDNGIPADFPTRVVREDPDREGLLYAGTEFGIFVSFDDGANWQRFQQNLPVTPVTDIRVYRKDLVLSTMGRSFWILDDVTPLHELRDDVTASDAHLFQPRAAYRMRYRGGFRGRSVTDPEYPPVGAVIDYYLRREPAGEITLEIRDDAGRLIREFSSAEPGSDAGQEVRIERLGTARLPKEAGLHRFRWDLRYPGPWDEDPRRSGRNGPMVIPGTYEFKFTANGSSETRDLVVLMDPRVLADGVTQEDVQAQLALNLKIRDATTEAKRAVALIADARDRLGGGGDERLSALERKLVTAPGRYQTPMLISQLRYLAAMTGRADQRPGSDAYTRFAELRRALDRYLEQLTELAGTR
ncbi:MAG: hypothetical protein ACE5HT_11540 [Gemmatimonadales bacterium]